MRSKICAHLLCIAQNNSYKKIAKALSVAEWYCLTFLLVYTDLNLGEICIEGCLAAIMVLLLFFLSLLKEFFPHDKIFVFGGFADAGRL